MNCIIENIIPGPVKRHKYTKEELILLNQRDYYQKCREMLPQYKQLKYTSIEIVDFSTLINIAPEQIEHLLTNGQIVHPN